jgi:hydroxypyruvate reductase/glycerate 2-kinase
MNDKEKIRSIFQSGLEEAFAKNFIPKSVTFKDNILTINDQSFDLTNYKNIYIYGSGKASIEMLKALPSSLKERASHSFVVCNYYEDIKNIEVFQSTHPLPSDKSLEAADRLLKYFENMGDNDFYIYLLSGGSSAMIEKPIEGVSLDDLIYYTEILLQKNLSIDEINIIRKQLSLIKGGGLSARTNADGAVLVLSDVVGDDLQSIGSAPLMPNKSSYDDFYKVLKKHNLFNIISTNIEYITNRGYVSKDVPHFILMNNMKALKKSQQKAEKLGFKTEIVTNLLQGDVRVVAKYIYEYIKRNYNASLSPFCFIFGGETTVEVKGSGFGGRNQELCLWFLKELQDGDNITFLSGATDGIDGNSIAMGGVVDIDNNLKDIDIYLDRNDSFHYLQREESLISFGYSGTNIADIIIVLIR